MTKIILARHTETDWNQVRRIQGGGSNVPLNEKGLKQAELLAQRLKGEEIQAIYSSPLKRALDTARIIAGHHGLEVTAESSFKEIDAGEYEGVAVADIGRRLSHILTAGQDGNMPRIPGGESLPELQQRAWGAIKRLAAEYPDGHLLVVSHFFAILSVVCAVLNLPLSHLRRFRLGTGSVTVIEVGNPVDRLLVFNDNCFQLDSQLY